MGQPEPSKTEVFVAEREPERTQDAETTSDSASDFRAAERHTVELGEGKLGVEILWSWPPVVTSVAPNAPVADAGLEPGCFLLEVNGRSVSNEVPEAELDALMMKRPLTLSFG